MSAHHYLTTHRQHAVSHRDEGHVLALQLYGKKRWWYEVTPGSDVWDTAVLTPGDLLWLPARTMHSTYLDPSFPPLSMHLTLEAGGDEDDDAFWTAQHPHWYCFPQPQHACSDSVSYQCAERQQRGECTSTDRDVLLKMVRECGLTCQGCDLSLAPCPMGKCSPVDSSLYQN